MKGTSVRYKGSALRITSYSVKVPQKYKMNGAVKIAVLADLHDRGYGFSLHVLADAIDEVCPDLIVSAGDLVTVKGSVVRTHNACSLIRHLSKRYPVFLTDGNHETRLMEREERSSVTIDRDMERLKSCQAVFLRNSSCLLNVNGLMMRLTGFVQPSSDYLPAGLARFERDMVENAVGAASDDAYQILLAHNPVHFEAYAGWGADLVLSGHLHGGMIRLPFLGGVAGPDLKLFPKYDKGAFEMDKSTMIVSAGLGAHTVPVRLNNPPELVVVTLSA